MTSKMPVRCKLTDRIVQLIMKAIKVAYEKAIILAIKIDKGLYIDAHRKQTHESAKVTLAL